MNRIWLSLLAPVALAGALVSCGGDDIAQQQPCQAAGFDDAQCAEIGSMILSDDSSMPASPTNAYADNAAAATLGQQLFFESDWSGPLQFDSHLGNQGQAGRVSCFSCHNSASGDMQYAGVDNSLAVGVGTHPRHAPPTANSGFYTFTNWAGRFQSIWSLPARVLEAGPIHNSTRLDVAHIIYDQYKDQYNAVFTDYPLPDALDSAATDKDRFPPSGKPGVDAWDLMAEADQTAVKRITVNVGKAMEAYIRSTNRLNSKFDKWYNGDGDLTGDERAGLDLFLGKGNCVECHSGSTFTNQGFRNIGVSGGDMGRFKDVSGLVNDEYNGAGAFSDDTVRGAAELAGLSATAPAADTGKFRVESLRNIAVTAPYMHNGSIATLADVVSFYNQGGGASADVTGTKDPLLVPLEMTAGEQAQLVAFLRALTGEEIPAALLVDTSVK